ncbi:uncharacterized protein NESG_01928 [Nematocida ausubeli]|uniref:Uncharacterized protein n=1 Tax=Nematocida ausubeli (strain ATCC PRA-371 / ERTm2) TaxID=1913371 RepID=A0A086J1C1_NEMA1|nr:uncharacterized protein NESG_01928 [Nematocida ausubeli]KAI5132722.1 hypothetical protein NEAUS06_0318 [Nematocida ausubeli]KAI5146637.1 hypothetical protein NEAUS05_0082 [Nematocida ausubeli]KFG25939.1 hypothetical protein NESG_01928 [Nematocida ausubeli]
MENTHSYSLTRKILHALEDDLEGLFNLLSKSKKKGLFIPSSILVLIIEDKKPLPPSKVLCMRLLQSNLEIAEEKKEISYLVSSMRFMFRISEIIKIDAENWDDKNQSEIIPGNTLGILECISDILGQVNFHRKEAILDVMQQAGIFLLINLWCTPGLLKFYNNALAQTNILVISDGKSEVSGNSRNEIGTARDKVNTPYRIPVEESLYNKTTVLVHRRRSEFFMPKYFRMYPEVHTEAYRRIFSFQDEYEIFHKSLVNWCKTAGNLKEIEFVCISHLDHLSTKVENETYENEVIFCLGVQFYSAVENTFEEGDGRLLKSYVKFIKKCREVKNPVIKGTSSVAANRITLQAGKYLVNKIISPGKETRNNPKLEIFRQKAELVVGLSALCDIFNEFGLHSGFHKIIERESGRILELLEIQPEEEIIVHCTSIIRVLSVLEGIPISLFSPSKLSLVLWVLENVEISDKKAKKWLDAYMQEISSIYNPAHENFIARSLCF